MRKLVLILAGAALLSFGLAEEAAAAGRVSRFAAMRQLSSPFDTLDMSSYSSSSFGLPVFNNESINTSSPVNVTAPASAEPEPVATPSLIRTPYRPRVRSPFRPPPRPSLP